MSDLWFGSELDLDNLDRPEFNVFSELVETSRTVTSPSRSRPRSPPAMAMSSSVILTSVTSPMSPTLPQPQQSPAPEQAIGPGPEVIISSTSYEENIISFSQMSLVEISLHSGLYTDDLCDQFTFYLNGPILVHINQKYLPHPMAYVITMIEAEAEQIRRALLQIIYRRAHPRKTKKRKRDPHLQNSVQKVRKVDVNLEQMEMDDIVDIKHIKIERKYWISKCQICGAKLLGGRPRYEAHMSNFHSWLCSCGAEFVMKQKVKQHVKKFTNVDVLPPDVDVSSRPEREHFILHKEMKKAGFECDHCDLQFKSGTIGQRHRKEVHCVEDEGDVYSEFSMCAEKCEQCGSIFSSERKLKTHIKMCHREVYKPAKNPGINSATVHISDVANVCMKSEANQNVVYILQSSSGLGLDKEKQGPKKRRRVPRLLQQALLATMRSEEEEKVNTAPAPGPLTTTVKRPPAGINSLQRALFDAARSEEEEKANVASRLTPPTTNSQVALPANVRPKAKVIPVPRPPTGMNPLQRALLAAARSEEEEIANTPSKPPILTTNSQQLALVATAGPEKEEKANTASTSRPQIPLSSQHKAMLAATALRPETQTLLAQVPRQKTILTPEQRALLISRHQSLLAQAGRPRPRPQSQTNLSFQQRVMQAQAASRTTEANALMSPGRKPPPKILKKQLRILSLLQTNTTSAQQIFQLIGQDGEPQYLLQCVKTNNVPTTPMYQEAQKTAEQILHQSLQIRTISNVPTQI